MASSSTMQPPPPVQRRKNQSSEKQQAASIPVCFELPVSHSQPLPPPLPEELASQHRLHGADDLISLFGLQSLWQRSVKPYTASAGRSKQRDPEKRSIIGVNNGEGASQTAGADLNALSKLTSTEDGVDAQDDRPQVLDKTYANYVQDIPGRVRPAKRTITRFNNAVSAAKAAGEAEPGIPEEITGRTTMADIVYRPETTVQKVGPFDEESLRAAFTVEAGDLQDIDLSLLEPDEAEHQTPSKKRKKRKHRGGEGRDGGSAGGQVEGNAAKRAKLKAMVGGRAG